MNFAGVRLLDLEVIRVIYNGFFIQRNRYRMHLKSINSGYSLMQK